MNRPVLPPFPAWVREQLQSRGMTQRELGDSAGVHHSTISRVVAGRYSANLSTVLRILEALDASPEDAAALRPFDQLPRRSIDPVERVQQALRSDDLLDEAEVAKVMRKYLSTRRQAERKATG